MNSRTNSNRDEWFAYEAAEWIDRLEHGGDDDEKAFLKYLAESPRNVQEALLASAWDRELSGLLDRDRKIDVHALIAACGNVVPMPGANPSTENRRTRPRWQWPALAASVAGAAVTLFLIAPSLMQWWAPSEFKTSIGEQRAIEFADGSVIALNTQSGVRVKFSDEAREVYLHQGQAMFTVAKDRSRPFRVHAGDAVVEAIGTKFDVRRFADRVSVAVIEGRVQVASDSSLPASDTQLAQLAERTSLAAGQAVNVAKNGVVTPPAPIDPTEVSAWQQRRLVFRNNTLAEIAEEFSRYNRTPQIRIEGEELRARRLPVAVFDADDPESLITYLASEGSIEVDRGSDSITIRQRQSVGFRD